MKGFDRLFISLGFEIRPTRVVVSRLGQWTRAIGLDELGRGLDDAVELLRLIEQLDQSSVGLASELIVCRRVDDLPEGGLSTFEGSLGEICELLPGLIVGGILGETPVVRVEFAIGVAHLVDSRLLHRIGGLAHRDVEQLGIENSTANPRDGVVVCDGLIVSALRVEPLRFAKAIEQLLLRRRLEGEEGPREGEHCE